MKNIIKGKNICKSYKNKPFVLNNIDIEISKGEFITIMGPSGSGKSTLLFALSGMDEINEGTILFKDREISKMKDEELSDMRRKNMGFVFQQPTMVKNLSIIDNILLPHLEEKGKNSEELLNKAENLLKELGILEIRDKNINEVSGGQLQRACICRAILGDPDIIFADEPTGALNSKAAMGVMEILKDINEKGKTLFLVTHDSKVAAKGSRILLLKDGKIFNDIKFKNEDEGEKMKIINEEMYKAEI